MLCSTRNTMQEREAILERIADSLEAQESEILAENRADVSDAALKINDHLMKRLTMDSLKIKQLADGIRSIARQREPVKKVLSAAPDAGWLGTRGPACSPVQCYVQS